MRSTRRITAALALSVASLSACGDQDRPIAGPGPSIRPAISDGASQVPGNPDFFFLPPLVRDPSGHSNFDAGGFSAIWQPVVSVCRANAALTGCESGVLKTWSGTQVALSTADQHYQVNWDTREAWATEGTYRVSISLVGSETIQLGFADVRLASGGAKNAITEDVIVMNDGRTIPIKFRIERGATTTASDFAEGVITNAGGTLTTGSKDAGAYFTPGWLNAVGLQSAVVTIEQLPLVGGKCVGGVAAPLVAGLLQFGGCYRFLSFPEIAELPADPSVYVDVGVCPVAPAVFEGSLEIYKYDAPSSFVKPSAVQVGFLECGTTTVAWSPRAPAERGLLATLRRGGSVVGRGVRDLFAPSVAWALDAGLGGRLDRGTLSEESLFSDFFWGVATRVDVVSGDGQSALAGTAVASPAKVRVTATYFHHHDDEGSPGIAGIPVTFAVTAGGGTVGGLASVVVVTDADGYAQAPWVLGATPGANALTATIPDDPNQSNRQKSVTFGATGTAPVATVDEVRVTAGNTLIGTDNTVSLPYYTYVPFNAQAIRDGTDVTGQVSCTFTSGNPSVLLVETQGNGASQVKGLQPTYTAPVSLTVTCGTATRVLSVSVQGPIG